MTATTPTCVCCTRPTADGYACTGCANRAAGHLATLIDLTPDARDVAHGLNSRGDGGTGGKPGSRPPGDIEAMGRLSDVQNTLSTLARDIAAARGVQEPDAGRLDVIVVASRWLAGQLEWLRHALDDAEPFASRAFDEIDACARRVYGMANGPVPGRYAGPCSQTDAEGKVCGEDVTARPGAAVGACKVCGSEYDVDEQQAWMRGEIEGYLARPVEIAGVLLRLGFPVGYSTIAAYAAKGQLIAHGSDEKGRALFRIGDVIDLRMGAKKPRRSLERPRGAANPAGG